MRVSVLFFVFHFCRFVLPLFSSLSLLWFVLVLVLFLFYVFALIFFLVQDLVLFIALVLVLVVLLPSLSLLLPLLSSLSLLQSIVLAFVIILAPDYVDLVVVLSLVSWSRSLSSLFSLFLFRSMSFSLLLSLSVLLFMYLSLFLSFSHLVYVLGRVLTRPPHSSCISPHRFPCPLFFILSFFRTNTRITKKLLKPKITRAMLHFTTLDCLVCPRLVSNSLNCNFTSTFYSFLEVELKCL